MKPRLVLTLYYPFADVLVLKLNGDSKPYLSIKDASGLVGSMPMPEGLSLEDKILVRAWVDGWRACTSKQHAALANKDHRR